jgi:hypothetical protein
MTPKCPECGSIIYSRRNVLCSVCGKRLPPDLLFTPEERQRVESDLDDMKRRTRAAQASEEKKASDLAACDSVAKRVGKHYPLLGAVIDFFTRNEGQ